MVVNSTCQVERSVEVDTYNLENPPMSGEFELEGPIIDALASEVRSIVEELGSDRAASIRLNLSNTTIGKARRGELGAKVLRAVLEYRGLSSQEDLLRRHGPTDQTQPALARATPARATDDDDDGLPEYRNFVLTKRHFAEKGVKVPDHIYEAVRPMRAYEGGQRTDIDIKLWINAVEDMLRNYEKAVNETRSAMLKRLGGTELEDDEDAEPRLKKRR
jgi:hypothetical protein